MGVSGLVVTADEGSLAGVCAALAADPRVTLGDPEGPRLPIVVETAGLVEDDQIWAWLHSVPGVRFVDVAYVHFGQGEDHDHG